MEILLNLFLFLGIVSGEGTRISLGVWSLLLFCVIPVFFLLLSSDEDTVSMSLLSQEMLQEVNGEAWVAVVTDFGGRIIVNDIQILWHVVGKATW